MKPVTFVGDALDALRDFPPAARNEAGFQLSRIQQGLDPDDWKPMSSIGAGVREIRVRDAGGAFRLIYIANLADTVYVLHAFQKKTQQTAQRDIATAMRRLRQITRNAGQ